LFFRLNVVPVSVPPLRERREDIPLLAAEFMRRLGRKHGVHVKGFTDAALRILNEHSWPGNVRELQNVVERAVILCGDSGILEPEHLGLSVQPASAPPAPEKAGAGDFPTLSELEKTHIFAALDRCKGNRTHAAKILDVSIRTLRNKLHEYNGTGLKPEEDKTEAEE
jgi:DNA-binding NtrC family response regulator